jgi:hypothetical protein
MRQAIDLPPLRLRKSGLVPAFFYPVIIEAQICSVRWSLVSVHSMDRPMDWLAAD